MPHSIPDLEKYEASSRAEHEGKGRKIEKVFPRLAHLGSVPETLEVLALGMIYSDA